jgi:hypothetical protein
LLSVALSLGSPPPDIIRRLLSVEPGLSSVENGGRPADWRGEPIGGDDETVKGAGGTPKTVTLL